MPEKVAFLDIDGVLFDVSARLDLSRKENGKLDYKVFLDPANLALDVPINDIYEDTCALFQAGFTVVLLTGRPMRMERETERQLENHSVQYHELYMRDNGDYRNSKLVKAEWVAACFDAYRIMHNTVEEVLIIDDQKDNLEAIAGVVVSHGVLLSHVYSNLHEAVQGVTRAEG